MYTFPAEVEQGNYLPSCFSFYTYIGCYQQEVKREPPRVENAMKEQATLKSVRRGLGGGRFRVQSQPHSL